MVERLWTWMKAANPEFGRADSKLQMAKRSMMGGQPKQIYQDMLTYNTIRGLRSKKFDVRSKGALHVFSTDFRDIALRRLHKKMPGPKLMIHDLQDLEQYEFYEGAAMHRLLRTVLGAKEVAILAMLATRQLEGEPLRIARMVQRVQFDSWYNHKIRPKTVKQAFEKGWEIRSTSSPGKAKSGPAQPGDSTYANDIARAFQKRCAELGQQRYHFFEH
ncbi:unnamed protein product [Hyaloperonospora brassicae]|uniref:RxLR effector candidate protein n=1 Tax=Hyaloperonospora brassicae TaxID=162125 RepID=A0AAV0UX85_HYABA|nr:unnamed protein product [Hyaloperonospora brassicae]